MTTALDAAKYLLTLDDPEAGDLTSNLKLQKLLYYAQGVHLAMHDEPLFDEPIQAWQHGPVVPNVYHEFKDFGRAPIAPMGAFDVASVPDRAREVLDEVHTVYGQFSAWRLREMTHEEGPWRDYYREGLSRVIPHSALAEFFRTQLVGG